MLIPLYRLNLFYFDFIEHNTEYGEHCHPNCDCGRYVEIGNSVFMEYIKTESGFEKLPKQNVEGSSPFTRSSGMKKGPANRRAFLFAC